MKAKTEEFLYFLLWTCDMLRRPTFRNLTDSFEGWAYRNGLHRQLAELERRKLLETMTNPDRGGTRCERALRLTEAGRVHALGGRDPQACWTRSWDGRWRLVLFDLPNEETRIRDRLRRSLSRKGFGYLQNSVWISPDPLCDEKAILAGSGVDVESLVVFEGRPCAGESDQEIVAGAWDFSLINRLYLKHMGVLTNRPSKPINDDSAAKLLRRWAAQERNAWLEAVSRDPFLPEPLLPANYLGRKAWCQRLEAMQCAVEQIRSFKVTKKSTYVEIIGTSPHCFPKAILSATVSWSRIASLAMPGQEGPSRRRSANHAVKPRRFG